MSNNRGRNVTNFSPFNFGYQPMYLYDDFKSLGSCRVSTETWHQQLSNTTPCTLEIERFRRCRKYTAACPTKESRVKKYNDVDIEIEHQEGLSKRQLKQVLRPTRCKTTPNIAHYSEEVEWPPKETLKPDSCEIRLETRDERISGCCFPLLWKSGSPSTAEETKRTGWISKVFQVGKKKGKSVNISNSKSPI
ncbi:hypothetical protein K7432_002456 [Basidiobolus ranarum]|uniref:Uncharacterized protein n=1 Tax=Basidiobolus ranarum TaxID=34480 RepID=A0ABR2X1J9_9FUNG